MMTLQPQLAARPAKSADAGGFDACPLSPGQIVHAARKCIDVPFRHQGRTIKGLDCVGLVRFPLWYWNHTELDFHTYKAQPNPLEMERHLDRYFQSIDPGAMQKGDILWLKVEVDPIHLAIWTGPDENTIIHAAAYGPGKVIEHAFRHPWPSRVHKVYRYKKLD